ncbi:hypothetical protein [Halorussus halobius]|uniref:hypothetical protein n=1 Tax=Halorussus halobius TaxID=1710537 RepID=UPI001092340B|nr:hypothetical protein [Halorussus halobius]
MERLYTYNAALAVIGVSMGLQAIPSLVAGERSIPLLLLAVGASGLVVAAVYDSLSTDPAEFEVSGGVLLVLVAGACLSLAGTVLELLITPSG